MLTLREIDAELRKREREAIEDEIGRRSFPDFVRNYWPEVEPDNHLDWNWHHDAICEHLQAVKERQIRTLLIEMPPRLLKSRFIAVMFPAFIWATEPGYGSIFGSYAAGVSEESSVLCRKVIESPRYQRNYAAPAGWSLLHDRNTVKEFLNTRGGRRITTSVDGTGTGKGGDLVVADDPLNSKHAYSEAERNASGNWWLKTMVSRLNDRRKGARVMVMQRLHRDDPAGRWLATGTVQVRLNLAMRYSARRTYSYGLGYVDPRTEEGELLHPERVPQSEVDTMAAELGPDANAQLDQDPAPEGGDFFKSEWWRFFRIEGVPSRTEVRPSGCASLAESPTRVVPVDNMGRPKWDLKVISLDANFKGKHEKNDPIALAVVATIGADRFVLGMLTAKVGFKETKDALRAACEEHPDAWAKLVEAKANGDAIVDDLTAEILGLILVEPEGGKEVRAHRCRPQVMAGNVYLLEGAPWLGAFLAEASAFPRGAHDDQIDALTQALNWLTANMNFAAWEALGKIR